MSIMLIVMIVRTALKVLFDKAPPPPPCPSDVPAPLRMCNLKVPDSKNDLSQMEHL